MMRFVGSLALCVGVGCGGGGGTSGGDPGGITGTLNGVAFSITDTISASIVQQSAHSAFVWLSNTADICGDIQTNRQRPSSQRVLIEMFDGSGSMLTTPTAPGTFSINSSDPSRGASMSTSNLDATCSTITAGTATATGGSVSLTAVNGDAFAGTFDVTFDSGDHLTGSFDPTACPELQMVFDPLYGMNCR